MDHLRQETLDDWWAVEALFDLCFAPGREALPSYRLRDRVEPVARLCMTLQDDDGELGAAIRFWPVRVGQAPVLLLGPIAVHPTRQGEGLGAYLIGDSLQRARALGWTRVLLMGDASYYHRQGFSLLSGVVMPPPANPARVLGLELAENAWRGVTGTVKPAS